MARRRLDERVDHRRLRDVPPSREPRAPRWMARPTPEPTDLAALLAGCCTRPSCLPPRGPVLPNRMLDSASVTTDPVEGAVCPAPPGCPACPAPAALFSSFS